MRLSFFWVADFKNLKDARIEFDSSSPYTVLVGENGSGKSNLLEALTWVFRNLDLDEPAPFTYALAYKCRENIIRVDAVKAGIPEIQVQLEGEEEFRPLTRSAFLSDDDAGRPLYRPAFVFGYYSGPSDRLSRLYDRHRERYRRLIISEEAFERNRPVESNASRRLFYAKTLHGQFALLAFFMQRGEDADADRAFLREHLLVDELDSVLFALQKPDWNRTRGGDPRFWRAEGEVRRFLAYVFDAALWPMRMERRLSPQNNAHVESLYLFLPSRASLEQVFEEYGNQYAFFTALESTDESSVLAEVRTRVRLTPEAGSTEVTYRDLSEGEQQLLLVLGLLKFTAEDETLFLLDEPDTHLNPAWAAQYLTFLDRFMQKRKDCHVVMSTHEPLVFAQLTKDQVRILSRSADGSTLIAEPEEDPRGLGVAAILTSDLFRLRTTLDPLTQADLDRQRDLAARESLTPDESAELEQLTQKLRELGFMSERRDPLFALFVREWMRQRPKGPETQVAFTPTEYHRRREIASQIIATLRAKSAKSS